MKAILEEFQREPGSPIHTFNKSLPVSYINSTTELRFALSNGGEIVLLDKSGKFDNIKPDSQFEIEIKIKEIPAPRCIEYEIK